MCAKVSLQFGSTFPSVIGCNGEIRALLGGSSQQSEQSILMTFTKWKTAHCIIYICHLVESYSGQV